MNIKLTRQIKLGGKFVKKSTVLSVSEAEGKALIEQECAQPFVVGIGIPSAAKKTVDTTGNKMAPVIPANFNSSDGEPNNNDTSDKTSNAADSAEENLDEKTDTDEAEKDTVDTSSFRVIDETLGKQESTGPFVIPGIDSATTDVLVKAGYTSIESLKALTMDALVALPKIGYQRAKKIFDYVKSV